MLSPGAWDIRRRPSEQQQRKPTLDVDGDTGTDRETDRW